MNANSHNIKLVAVDMDGTIARTDYTYDISRFKAIFSRMKEVGCQFVVAGGNQYYQLRSLFPEYHHQLSFVAERGNDIEMLEYCGRSYAMENAPDNVKAVADFVCPSNNNDGVLVTLDKLFPVN